MLRLRDLREDKDMSQEQLGKILNVSQAAYSYYESEKRSLTLEMAGKLALYFNTSIDYIVGLTNEKKPYPRNKNKLED